MGMELRDNPRNQDGIGERELLTVSFGTSYNDSRIKTIGAIEETFEREFPEYSVRRAFTSEMIIHRIKSRDGESIDHVTDALERAVRNGVRYLVIQPTHVMNGLEYNDLEAEAKKYAGKFETMAIGAPLLTSDEDFRSVIRVITERTKEYDEPGTAICFMGHGTEAASNLVYAKMQDMLRAAGYDNYLIGTVEAAPGLPDVLEEVRAGGYGRVVLAPLMIVAGDHANNDMAGDEEDSWKSEFLRAGCEVVCLMRGLGEFPEIQELFASHVREAVNVPSI